MGASARAAETHGHTDQPAGETHGHTDRPAGETHGHVDLSGPVSDQPAEEQQSAADALEAALEQLGPFGLYQRYSVALLCVASMLAAIYSLDYVFTADRVPFRCAVQECEGAAGAGGYWNQSAAALLPAEPCRRYAPLEPRNQSAGGGCERAAYHPHDTIACESFLYENYDTIYAEFELACREWQRTLAGKVRDAALPFALLLTGYLSDTYGRVTALCVFSACAGVLGIVKGFSVTYSMYLAVELLEAALGHGLNTAAYVMLVELARPAQRAAFACLAGVARGAGGVVLAWGAWRVRYWRRVLWAAHAPALLLPLYWLLLDESWRWLLARGQPARAASLLRKAARWNKVTLDEATMRKVESGDEAAKQGSCGTVRLWRSVVRSRVLAARLAGCAWCWAAAAFLYYGLTVDSVSLAGDKYVNFALNMAMEIVASLLLVMALERFGRRWSISGAFLVCGVACVTPFFLAHAAASLGLFFVGKLSTTFAYNSLHVQSAELFPTATRCSALAVCSLAGHLASILGPQTTLLSGGVQAALYGACSVTGALAAALAPETRRARLPPDVASAERLRARTPRTRHVTRAAPPRCACTPGAFLTRPFS